MSLTVTFPTQLPSQSSINVIMALSLILNQCSGRFPCRLSSGPLKRKLLDIYLSTSFGDGSFGNTEARRVIFVWKCSKFNADSENAEKNSEKVFCFLDKCIWIVCIQLSLLIREYLSSAVNVLRKRLKNVNLSMCDFSNLITFTVIPQDDEGALINTESVLHPVYHVTCREVLSKGNFETFILAPLPWAVNLELHKLWGSSFFENVQNLMQVRKMQKEIEKKFSFLR